jgi:SAM-dependent methyltransferase
MAVPRRLVFGEAADLYDLHRPTYPPALVEDLIQDARWGAGQRILEVGAGTGKATTLFAARGVPVLGIEPSPRMAAIARRNCAAYPDAEIVESDFERWDPGGETFPLVYAAQAWHWIDPELRYVRARRALTDGGGLALFWNRAAWGRSEMRDALISVYERIVPDMPTTGTMHPARSTADDHEDWASELSAAPEFTDPVLRTYSYSLERTAAAFAGLVATLSETRLLQQEVRRRLIDAIRDTIDERGGTITVPMVTHLHLARAA